MHKTSYAILHLILEKEGSIKKANLSFSWCWWNKWRTLSPSFLQASSMNGFKGVVLEIVSYQLVKQIRQHFYFYLQNTYCSWKSIPFSIVALPHYCSGYQDVCIFSVYLPPRTSLKMRHVVLRPQGFCLCVKN